MLDDSHFVYIQQECSAICTDLPVKTSFTLLAHSQVSILISTFQVSGNCLI